MAELSLLSSLVVVDNIYYVAVDMVYVLGLVAAMSLVSARDQAVFGQDGVNGISPEPRNGERLENEWDCTLRGWVRAPDLAPSQSFPGEARLAANGSACRDIEAWSVGLRMKERAIVKLKNRSASFPVKPTRKPFNTTARGTVSTDYNDIFRASNRIRYDTDDDEYRTARLAYDEAISNRKLWDVEGVERRVFDNGRALPFEISTEGSDFDMVESFYVNVPNTNFPPIEDRTLSSQVQGSDDQLLNAETLFEYYLNVTLSNGTIMDIPAGRAGFVPRMTDLADGEWPRKVVLSNPRVNSSDAVDGKVPEMSMSWEPKVPDCDTQNRVDFDMVVTPTLSIATAGQNITLDIILNRRGNGTEYPSVLNVNLHSSKELDWAKTRLGSDAAYHELLNDKSHPHVPLARQNGYMSTKRLAIKPMDVLEKDREQREKSKHGSSYSYGQNRHPLSPGQGRYDFEDLEEAELDQYRFQIELHVPYNLLPTFNATFQSFHPRISFQLHTVFLCVLDDNEAEEGGMSDVSVARDIDWIEAELPPSINRSRRNDINQRGLSHTSQIDFGLILPAVPATTSQESGDDDVVVSYSNALARAPVISLEQPMLIEYPMVNHEIRKENKVELLRSRYNNHQRMGRTYPKGNCNPGGAYRHAAKMWQAKEFAARQLVLQGQAESARTDIDIQEGSVMAEML